MAEIEQAFDTMGFFRSLEATVITRRKTWKEVAAETGISASTLTRMSQGRHPDAPSLAKLGAWAGLNPADFVKGRRTAARAEPLAMVTRFLSADPNLSSEGVAALDEVIKATYRRLASNPKATKRRNRE